ncbi:hypothetical protein VC83_08170 [Pseudogymnoascus destructans]|uniref:Uncharacterized protein n=1 Tax=Pseudogymnoascus destructans TaxID=655981 RepID=A0A176ZYV3_9PEZI|nr:uncharacterized protein VC83_08170 [Pseudogymnoascus destructans]OAF55225.1 hypothetical protein VC83_08170 [Pseudogymnoascus destructans]
MELAQARRDEDCSSVAQSRSCAKAEERVEWVREGWRAKKGARSCERMVKEERERCLRASVGLGHCGVSDEVVEPGRLDNVPHIIILGLILAPIPTPTSRDSN